MLQWPGYKLPNSGVHGLGLAPRVWLITDCNHCKVTLILQRSPIICDWSNVPSLHDLLFSVHSHETLVTYICTINEPLRSLSTDRFLNLLTLISRDTNTIIYRIYNWFIIFSTFYFMKLILDSGYIKNDVKSARVQKNINNIISDRNTQLLFGSFLMFRI